MSCLGLAWEGKREGGDKKHSTISCWRVCGELLHLDENIQVFRWAERHKTPSWKADKELSFPTFGILQHKAPSDLISTARAPSSDSLPPPLWDVDLNILVSNGRSTQLEPPLLRWCAPHPICQHQTVIPRYIKLRDAKSGTAYKELNPLGFFRHAPNICAAGWNQR